MKRLAWVMVLVGLAGGGWWVLSRPAPPVDVTVVSMERGDVRIVMNSASAGEVVPEQRAMIRGEAPGTVLAVHKKRGERVQKGDLVIVLDSRDVRAQLGQAEAAVEVARSGVEAAQTRVAGVEKQRARVAVLVKSGSGAAADLERMDIELAAAQAAVRTAEAQLKQAQAATQVARVALQRTELRAPFAGVLQDVLVTVGMQVTPGVPIFDLIDDSHVYLQAPMDEVDAPRVREGQDVAVSFDSLRTRELPGKVRLVAPALGRDERLSRTLRVEIDLQDAPPLRVGMAANVSVIERVVPGTRVLPTLSVLGRGLERAVLVVTDLQADGSGTVKRRVIKVGASNDDLTEVISGIEPTEHVVHVPNDPAVKEGMHARPVPLGRPSTQLNPLAESRDVQRGPEVAPATTAQKQP